MIRITKKAEVSAGRAVLLQLGAVLVALAAAGIVMAIIGYNPFAIYIKMIEGSLATSYRIQAMLNKAIPLVLLSLGIAVAFKMKFWNIGAEGQMAMGGFGAALIALNFGYLPSVILLPLMALSGMFFAALWGLVPTLLKTKLGTSETLVTLMLNYIALRWLTYLQYGPWREGGFPKIPNFSENGVMPTVFGVHAGWIVAVVMVVVVYILLQKSKLGYEIAVIGESQATARYAGIGVTKITIVTMLISAALCGLAGMIQTSAVEKTLNEAFTGGLGFTAVITTYLAKLSPVAIVLTSVLFGILIQGGSFLETSMKVPSAMSGVLQGIIILFVLSFEFFTQYRVSFRKKSHEEEAAK